MNKEALALIANSSSIDFDNCLQWGQWCRQMARAALNGDDEEIARLRQEIEKVAA